MINSFLIFIAIYGAQMCFGIGDLPIAPNLSAATLASLIVAPEAAIPPATETVLTCFDGFVLVDDMCIREINVPATQICPTGLLVDDGCQVTAPYLLMCPPGYTQSDGEAACLKTREVPIQFYCPKGFYDDGNSCAQSIPGEVVQQCDVGELIGDQCVSFKQTPQLLSSICPPGAEVEEDGNCWKIIDTFDCTLGPSPTSRLVTSIATPPPLGDKITIQIPKKSETVVVSPSTGRRVRHLGKKRDPEPEQVEVEIIELVPEPPCFKEMVSVTAPRPIKVGVASQICFKKIQVEALALTSCAPGFLDNGVICVSEEVTPPVVTCLTNGRIGGACPPVIRRTPKTPGCPKNAEARDGFCFELFEVAPLQSCAKGFIDNGLGCIGAVELPALECRGDLVLEGDRCIGQMSRPPVSLVLEPNVPCASDKKY